MEKTFGIRHKFAHQPGCFRTMGQTRLGQVGAAHFLMAWIDALIFLTADDALHNKSCFMIAPAAGLRKSGNFRFLCKNFSYLAPLFPINQNFIASNMPNPGFGLAA